MENHMITIVDGNNILHSSYHTAKFRAESDDQFIKAFLIRFESFKKKYENQLSDVDTIALGVKKAKSPASYELIAIFMTFVFGGFWFVAYFIISLSSIVLAPLMTLFVAYKAVKFSK